MPVIRAVQKQLRERGQGLFDALAKPGTVAQILKEPYAVTSAIDDELVAVLLDPLLTPGASDVVFDTLSYSAGTHFTRFTSTQVQILTPEDLRARSAT